VDGAFVPYIYVGLWYSSYIPGKVPRRCDHTDYRVKFVPFIGGIGKAARNSRIQIECISIHTLHMIDSHNL
jgi:hypothetical protein